MFLTQEVIGGATPVASLVFWLVPVFPGCQIRCPRIKGVLVPGFKKLPEAQVLQELPKERKPREQNPKA
jgi:hypothetical protein